MNNKLEQETLPSNVEVVDEAEFNSKLEALAESGLNRLAVFTDFDRTLTIAYVDGERRSSITSVLRDGNYISSDYADKAQKLYDKYHLVEDDPDIDEEGRAKAMESWWRQHFQLLIESGLNINHIHQVVEAGEVKFRVGAKIFFEFLAEKGVPLVIVSSSGLGVESIDFVLKEEGFNYDNIRIISNQFIWNKNGRADEVKEPIVHLANKDQVTKEEVDVVIKDDGPIEFVNFLVSKIKDGNN